MSEGEKGNAELIAYCGLYCENCRSYKKGKCLGCQKNEKATWCTIRKCCISNNYSSCVDCVTITDYKECKKINNFIAKVISFIFKSDRFASLENIKKNGRQRYADGMCVCGSMCIKKK